MSHIFPEVVRSRVNISSWRDCGIEILLIKREFNVGALYTDLKFLRHVLTPYVGQAKIADGISHEGPLHMRHITLKLKNEPESLCLNMIFFKDNLTLFNNMWTVELAWVP